MWAMPEKKLLNGLKSFFFACCYSVTQKLSFSGQISKNGDYVRKLPQKLCFAKFTLYLRRGITINRAILEVKNVIFFLFSIVRRREQTGRGIKPNCSFSISQHDNTISVHFELVKDRRYRVHLLAHLQINANICVSIGTVLPQTFFLFLVSRLRT